MAVYNSAQRSREGKSTPTDGIHTMTVKIEKPNAKMSSQHSFLLVNDQFECWFNCFVTELDAFGTACGLPVNAAQDLDTSAFVGKTVAIKYGKKMAKNGKEYAQVLEYAPATSKPVNLAEDLPF